MLVADIYPGDLGTKPNFKSLVGREVGGKKFVGCVIKASEGVGWGRSNEAWFVDNWKRCRDAGGDEYGRMWFRGAYHFLRLDADGAKQADYFLGLVERAGGFGTGDLMPWVDVEEGGQGNWAGGERLESITDPAKRKRLSDDVRRVTAAFIKRFKQRYPNLRIAVYGRGIFRDLRMTDCRFGEDSFVNPAYTATMPRMEQYGVPLEHISLWQLSGDGKVFCPGFPGGMIDGWGAEDYSVFIDGSNATTLNSFRKYCLASGT